MEQAKAIIRKEGSKWVIYSHDGKKKLGTFDSEEQAKKRLREIEYFKHKKGASFRAEILDNLTKEPGV